MTPPDELILPPSDSVARPLRELAKLTAGLSGGVGGLLVGGAAGVLAVPLAFSLLFPEGLAADGAGQGVGFVIGVAGLLGGMVTTSAGLLFGSVYGAKGGVKAVDACYKLFFSKKAFSQQATCSRRLSRHRNVIFSRDGGDGPALFCRGSCRRNFRLFSLRRKPPRKRRRAEGGGGLDKRRFRELS